MQQLLSGDATDSRPKALWRRLMGLLPSLWILGLSASLVSSCALFSSLQPQRPEVKLSQVNFDTLSWTKVQMSVGLDLYNPNDFNLKVNQIEYKLTALDKVLGEGVYDKTFEIEAGKRHQLSLPFTLRPVLALEVAKRFINGNEALPVKIEAKAVVDTLLGALSFTFEDSTTILSQDQN